MADKEIGDLTAAGALTGAELVHVVKGGNSRQTTAQAIANTGSLAELSDVDTSGIADGDVLKWDASNGVFYPADDNIVTIDTDGTLSQNSDGVVASQKATKTYVDGKIAGLSWKQEVRAATTSAGTLATSFASGQTIDGVTLALGDRILVKNQASGSENGIYTVNLVGAPTRATDADDGAELVDASCYVSEGTTNADTQWVCTTNAPITVGSTSLTFSQFTSGSGALQASNNLSDVASKVAAKDTISVKGADIASASTTDLSAATGDFVTVTGTTAITALGTAAAGVERTVHFSGALTLTHNATSLILPTGANITTAAGDVARFRSLGSGNWRCTGYMRASGAALTGGGSWELAQSWTYSVDVANVDFANLGAYTDIMVVFRNVTSSISFNRGIRLSTDNGSTFYSTSGDYVIVAASGSETGIDMAALHSTTTTTERTGIGIIFGANVSGSIKVVDRTNRDDSGSILFVADTDPINAVRFLNGAGNLTGGSIYVFGRR